MALAWGDVSNKGAGAALLMARADALLRGLADSPQSDDIAAILLRLGAG